MEAAWPLTFFAGPGEASVASQPSPHGWDALIWSLLALQAMRGAKAYAGVLAAKNPGFGASSRCAESRKRIVVSTIAIETLERAHPGIRSGRIAGNQRHRGTAVRARMNFNSVGRKAK
jgi:hypothetical protein